MARGFGFCLYSPTSYTNVRLLQGWLRSEHGFGAIPGSRKSGGFDGELYGRLDSRRRNRQLLAAVLELYAEGIAQEMQGLLDLSWTAGSHFTPESDILLETVFDYFQKNQRLAQAVEYFRLVKTYCTDAAVQLAKALTALDLTEEAGAELKEAAEGESLPTCPQLALVAIRKLSTCAQAPERPASD
eukprot:1189971-Prorocentrum_minimum.AAC.2